MNVDALEIRGLRNVGDMFLNASRSVNWVVGGNGAGKTSVLESIFLLSRGKSFRGRKHGELIQLGRSEARVSARVTWDHGAKGKCEVLKVGGATEFRYEGSRIHSLQGVPERLHVRLIGSNSQSLLEGGPALRRLFLDWNLFHVEQWYRELLLGFRRALTQRNTLLRAGGRGTLLWDRELADLGTKLTEARRSFVGKLQQQISILGRTFYPLTDLELVYSQGWSEGRDLLDALRSSSENDRRRGFTSIGPCRADFFVKGLRGNCLGSRGQIKVAVCGLQLAAQKVSQNENDLGCVWLLDDIGSELDEDLEYRLWQLFESTNQQIFATALNRNDIVSGQANLSRSLFHVEHGALVEVSG